VNFHSYFDRRKKQFRATWPGFQWFWPGLPIGLVAGVVLFVFVRTVLAEPLAIAAALLILFFTFSLIQVFSEIPGIRQHWAVAAASALVASSLGVLLTMAVAYAVAFGAIWLMGVVGLQS